MTPSVVTTKLAQKKKLRSDLIFMFQIHNPREVTNITKKKQQQKRKYCILFYSVTKADNVFFFHSSVENRNILLPFPGLESKLYYKKMI